MYAGPGLGRSLILNMSLVQSRRYAVPVVLAGMNECFDVFWSGLGADAEMQETLKCNVTKYHINLYLHAMQCSMNAMSHLIRFRALNIKRVEAWARINFMSWRATRLPRPLMTRVTSSPDFIPSFDTNLTNLDCCSICHAPMHGIFDDNLAAMKRAYRISSNALPPRPCRSRWGIHCCSAAALNAFGLCRPLPA